MGAKVKTILLLLLLLGKIKLAATLATMTVSAARCTGWRGWPRGSRSW